jgi:hypothetical protein
VSWTMTAKDPVASRVPAAPMVGVWDIRGIGTVVDRIYRCRRKSRGQVSLCCDGL